MEAENRPDKIYIIWESILGIVLGIIFIIIDWNNDDVGGETIADGIIILFGGLSLVFFFSVFAIGIIGAIKLKRTNNIARAIIYSIFFGVLSNPHCCCC